MKVKSSLSVVMTMLPLLIQAQEASPELLEFIGEWQEYEGEWVDPLSIDEEQSAKQTQQDSEQRVSVGGADDE